MAIHHYNYDAVKRVQMGTLDKKFQDFWECCEAILGKQSSMLQEDEQLCTMTNIMNTIVWYKCMEWGYTWRDSQRKILVRPHTDAEFTDYRIDELPKKSWKLLTDKEKSIVVERSQKNRQQIAENPYFWDELSDEQREIICDFREKLENE